MKYLNAALLIVLSHSMACGGPKAPRDTEDNASTIVVDDRDVRATPPPAVQVTTCGLSNPCDPIVSCTLSAIGEPICGACPNGFTGDGSDLCVFSETEVSEAVSSRSQYFATANDEPFLQQTSTWQMRNVWVSIEAIDAYRKIDPTDQEQQIEAFPVGTMLMHEPVTGPPFGGVMVKREPGYDPELNDWWFGRFDRYDLGYLESTDPRVPGYSGQSCFDCHVTDGRPERTDLLWGIPRDALADVTSE